MSKKKRKKWIAVFLMLVLTLTGCSEGSDEIPELISPVVNNQSYRPVEYGRVGRLQIKIANVVAEEYCHFAKKTTEISEIKVDIGDYVEEGAVLASIDVEEFQAEIENKNAEITLKKNVMSYKDKIYQEQLKEQEFKKKACEQEGDTKGKKECEVQINVIKENRQYDNMLYTHQIKMLNEEIEEIREAVDDGTIKARHAGYVTYIKDLTETSTIQSMENVVIVSDYDSLHIELAEDLSSNFYETWMKTYDEMYTVIAGKEYEVEPYSYTNAQLIAVQSSGLYPKIRMQVKGNDSGLHSGDKIPVYFASGSDKEVLKIGTDSLYQDGEQYFVYVKAGNDKERRDIEIGQTNMTDVEVVSGLEEGEWVFYSSNAALPEEYEEYHVEMGEYSSTVEDRELNYQYTYTKVYAYTQDVSATVESLNFSKGDTVQKGDLICVLDTGAGSAKIKEAANAVNNLKTDYDKNKEEYDKQISSLEKQIKKKKKEKDKQQKEAEENTENVGIENPNTEQEQSEAAGNQPGITENQTETIKSQTKVIGEAAGTAGEQTKTTEEAAEAGEQTKTTEGAAGAGEQTKTTESQTGTTAEQAKTTEEAAGAGEQTKTTESQTGTTTEQAKTAEKTAGTTGEQTQSEETAYAYEAEQLECQKNILSYEKSILEAQYQYDHSLLQKEYDRIAKGNNGYGKLNIYAEHSGVVGNVNIYEGKQILPEEDPKLFQIYDEASQKLIIDTGEEFVGAGNEAVFTYKSDKEKQYTGHIVGNSAVTDKCYLSEVDERVYVTNSISESGKNKVYITIDDQEFYENQEGCNVTYSNARIQNAIVLPVAMVNEEVNKKDESATYYYVWKVVDGMLVKQYVQTDEALMTVANVCILDGLKDGDVLAKQKVNEAEEE